MNQNQKNQRADPRVSETRTKLEELLQWEKELPQIQLDAYQLKAVQYRFTPAANSTTSPVEKAHDKIENLTKTLEEITILAIELGWEKPPPTPLQYVYAKYDWALNHYPAAYIHKTINEAWEKTCKQKQTQKHQTEHVLAQLIKANPAIPLKEAAKILKLDTKTLHNQCRNGRLNQTPEGLIYLGDAWHLNNLRKIRQNEKIKAEKTISKQENN